MSFGDIRCCNSRGEKKKKKKSALMILHIYFRYFGGNFILISYKNDYLDPWIFAVNSEHQLLYIFLK